MRISERGTIGFVPTLGVLLNSTHGHTFPYVFDRVAGIEAPWDCAMISSEAEFDEYSKRCDGFVIGIGGHNGRDRVAYAERLERNGLRPIPAIYPTAYFGKDCKVGKGLLARQV